MFCIIRDFVNIDCDRLFSVIEYDTSHTRGHNFKVFKQHCNINFRLNSFGCHNTNVWKSLPNHVVESDSAAIFKCKLSRANLLCSQFSVFLGYLLVFCHNLRVLLVSFFFLFRQINDSILK